MLYITLVEPVSDASTMKSKRSLCSDKVSLLAILRRGRAFATWNLLSVQ